MLLYSPTHLLSTSLQGYMHHHHRACSLPCAANATQPPLVKHHVSGVNPTSKNKAPLHRSCAATCHTQPAPQLLQQSGAQRSKGATNARINWSNERPKPNKPALSGQIQHWAVAWAGTLTHPKPHRLMRHPLYCPMPQHPPYCQKLQLPMVSWEAPAPEVHQIQTPV